MERKIITLFGGSGFIGRYLVNELAKTGATLRIVSRNPEQGLFLKTSGPIGQVVLSQANIRDERSVRRVVEQADIVINVTGILAESGKQRFSSIHAQGPELLARAAKEAGAERFVHFSALGVDKYSKSNYARSKATGERAVLAAFPEATILRPSIVFGAEDNFFNKFAAMSHLSPALPLIGGGRTEFQPVYVGDIARTVRVILDMPYTMGRVVELGGPRIYSFRQLMELILRILHKKRLLLPIPFNMASVMGAFLELFPSPLLTRDQVQMLKHPNIVSASNNDILTMGDVGIEASSLEMILPSYLL